MSLPVNQVLVGDCLEVMKGFPADTIDLVVTSPPYWGLRDYGPETVKGWGGDSNCEHEWEQYHADRVTGGGVRPPQSKWKDGPKYDVSRIEGFCLKCGAWRGSLGLEPHPQLFIDHLIEIFREVKRVLKPSGSFWLNLGDTYYGSGGKGNQYEKFSPDKGQPEHYKQNSNKRSNWLQPKQLLGIPWRTAIALQEDGWILRNAVIWHKPNHMPSSVQDRLTNSYEHVFHLVKNQRYFYDLNAIRQPFTESTISRISEPNLLNQTGGEKQDALRGKPRSGNASRSSEMVKSLVNTSPKEYEKWYFMERQKKSWHDHQHDPEMGFGQQKRGFKVKSFPHPKGKNPGDVWEIPTKPFSGAHFAVFPPKLINPIIKASCPKTGIVLDPFCGSGTALRVARKLGRKFIGIEINPKYAAMAERRIKADRYQEPPENVTSLLELSPLQPSMPTAEGSK